MQINYEKFFNHRFYILNNNDVILKNYNEAWKHANLYGWKENRIIFKNFKINSGFISSKKKKIQIYLNTI